MGCIFIQTDVVVDPDDWDARNPDGSHHVSQESCLWPSKDETTEDVDEVQHHRDQQGQETNVCRDLIL